MKNSNFIQNCLSLLRKNFVMKRTDVTESIRKALEGLPYHMEAWLYGSEARGESRPDSDIDLLILVDKPTVSDKDEDEIFTPLYLIELQSGILINPLIMPKTAWGDKVTPFYLNVNNERVKLWAS